MTGHDKSAQDKGKSNNVKRAELSQRSVLAAVILSISAAAFLEELYDGLEEFAKTRQITTGCYFQPEVEVSLALWLATLGVAFAYQKRVSKELENLEKMAGTLYYIWAQPGNRFEWHRDALPVLGESANETRSILRRLPYVHAGDRTYDVTECLTSLCAELERCVNDDDRGTSFRVVPDLIWPMAFRLGNLWFTPSEDIEFIEVRKKKENPRSRQIECETSPNDIRWRWVEYGALRNNFPKVEDFDSVEHPYPCIIDHPKGRPITQRPLEVSKKTIKPKNVKVVKLVLCLNDADFSIGPFASLESHKRSPNEHYDLIRVVAPLSLPLSEDSTSSSRSQSKEFDSKQIWRTKVLEDCKGFEDAEISVDDDTPTVMRVDGATLSLIVAESIAQTLDEFPEAEIEVHARLPKTVALAAGMYITHIESTGESKQKNPEPTDYWKRLSLMHFDVESKKSIRVVSHFLESEARENR